MPTAVSIAACTAKRVPRKNKVHLIISGWVFNSPCAFVPEFPIKPADTVTVDSRYIKNEPHYSYVLAAGTASFADDAYIGGRSYANRDIIFNAMKNFGRKTVPLDLDFKVFEDEGLDITKAQANRLTVLITVVPSVIVFGVGIYVWTRRRYL